MKSDLECLECSVRQAIRLGRASTGDPAMQRRLVNDVAQYIAGINLEKSPAVMSLPIYAMARELTGEADPYRALRRQQNDEALALEPELRAHLAASTDPLDTALHLAAAGNIIDLGILQAHEINVHEAIERALHERFAVDDSADLRTALAGCGPDRELLYFLDNAGEVVFDKLVIEELVKHVPVTAVVKAGPILNDVILEDAEYVGLTDVCSVIDCGGAYIGTPLGLIPPALLDRMRRAGVVIGKGQGNYETLDDFDGNVFLILKAKCDLVARHMGVQLGQVGLISTRRRARAHGVRSANDS